MPPAQNDIAPDVKTQFEAKAVVQNYTVIFFQRLILCKTCWLTSIRSEKYDFFPIFFKVCNWSAAENSELLKGSLTTKLL